LPGASRMTMFQRLMRWLGVRSKTPQPSRITKRLSLDHSTTYVWNDPKTGKEMTTTLLEEVPPEVRRQIEALAGRSEAEEQEVPCGTTFVFRDASGQERTYRSLDEMPPTVRALFEQRQRKHGGSP